MIDEKFTPAPWHVYDDGLIVDVFGEGDKRICGVDGFYTDIRPNAHLIAAAPELFEFVKFFTTVLGQISLQKASNGELIYEEAIKLCKKARGEE